VVEMLEGLLDTFEDQRVGLRSRNPAFGSAGGSIPEGAGSEDRVQGEAVREPGSDEWRAAGAQEFEESLAESKAQREKEIADLKEAPTGASTSGSSSTSTSTSMITTTSSNNSTLSTSTSRSLVWGDQGSGLPDLSKTRTLHSMLEVGETLRGLHKYLRLLRDTKAIALSSGLLINGIFSQYRVKAAMEDAVHFFRIL
jgi:hypothetical protein